MSRRALYPIGAWLLVAVGFPLALIGVGFAMVALTDLGELPCDNLHLWWLIAAAPLAGLFMLYGVARRRRALDLFASTQLAPLLAARISPVRQAFRAALLILAALSVAVAIAGPRWGTYTEKEEAYGVDVVVAIDVSRSMLARDVVPNRIANAKTLIRRNLAERSAFRRMHRLGLLAFAGSTSLRMPLSTDHLAFRNKLEQTGIGSAPRGGTVIAEAIGQATLLLESSPEKAAKLILLFTDGEDHDGDPVEAARQANSRGIRVFTIGVGDASLIAGAEVPDRVGPGARPLLHDGQIVFSKLDLDGLRAIADAGGGQYTAIANFRHLVDAISGMHKTRLATEERERHRPRYQWFLAAALLCLLLEPLIREGRRSTAKLPQRVWQQEMA